MVVYDEKSIKVLKGLDGVRKRPAMYIGDTGVDGFHHLVWEVLDNAVDEAVAGHCNQILVKFNDDDSVTVFDNGRGIPVGIHPTEGIPTLDVVMTVLHAGGKFGGADSAFKTSGGLHGVGASVVNALSEWMAVQVKRDGIKWRREYVNGVPSKPDLDNTGTCDKKETGTLVRFKPDRKYFREAEFDDVRIRRRLRELSFLNPGLRIDFKWLDGSVETFQSEGGLAEYVEYLLGKKTKLCSPICFNGGREGFEAYCSFVYDTGFDEVTMSFANNINTVEGGVHMNAALDSLCKTITNVADNAGLFKNLGDLKPLKSDVCEGLTLVVSVRVQEPSFGGQTKTKLANDELRKPMGEWFTEMFEEAFSKDKAMAKAIAGKLVDSMKARDAARKAKTLSRKKSVLESMSLPGKLSDCSSKDPIVNELYIVEGDSAGGTAIMARDRTFQAVLPLRGKVLNVLKTTLNKAMGNNEIAALIAALGVGVTEREAYIDDLRYHKVIIACLTGETDVPLLNGKTYTIQELAEGKAGESFWVYSTNEAGEMVPAMAYMPRKTGESDKLVEITFDDGSVVRCTTDHKWIRKSGEVIEAKDLQANDSLLSIHRRLSSRGYEQVFVSKGNKSSWWNTHSVVAADLWAEEKTSCLSRSKSRKNCPVVHHLDFDKCNNSPENLAWLLWEDHTRYHQENASIQITKYNKSAAHRERVTELHKQGHYKDFTWADTYNGSEKHLAAIARAWNDEAKRSRVIAGLITYNQSEANSRVASARNKRMWQKPEYRAKMLRTLVDSQSGEEISARVSEQWKKPGMKERMVKGKVLRLINRLLNEGNSVDRVKEIYDLEKPHNTKRLESAVASWGEGIFEEARHYNRMVKSVRVVTCETPVPVYNLTVAGTHNYMLGNGVITKNCDADQDGGHILCLLLSFFFRFMKKMIEEGHVYICEPPLYRVRIGSESKYLKNDDALVEFREKNPTRKIEVSRFKGLGEMDMSEFAETAMEPTSRTIRRVYMEDECAVAAMLNTLMGDGPENLDSRKEFLAKKLKFGDGE